MPDNRELLTRFHQDRSDAAFTEIVDRHRQFVYKICRGEIGDDALAEDVTQAVFLILADRAKSIAADTPLPGWLFQTARFVSRNAVRARQRRRRYELAIAAREVENMRRHGGDLHSEPVDLLMDALASLRAADRDLLLAEYYEGLTGRELAQRMNISEAAVRTRISRALGKMRRWYAAHGAAPSAILLSALLAGEWKADAQPAGLATASIAYNLANSKQITQGALHAMRIQKLKTALAICLAAGVAGGVIAAASVPAGTATTRAPQTAATAPPPSTPAPKEISQEYIGFALVTVNTAKFAALRAHYLKGDDASLQNGGGTPAKSTPKDESPENAPDADLLYKATLQDTGQLLSNPGMIILTKNTGNLLLGDEAAPILLAITPAESMSTKDHTVPWSFQYKFTPQHFGATGPAIQTSFDIRIPKKQTVLLLETPIKANPEAPQKSFVIFAYTATLTPSNSNTVGSDNPFSR